MGEVWLFEKLLKVKLDFKIMIKLGLLAALLSSCATKHSGPGRARRYLLAYFKTGEEALHLAYSEDSKVWRELNRGKPILRSSLESGIRDPSVTAGPDGNYHLVWTATPDAIGYSSTKDFVHFSPQKLISIKKGVLLKARNAWAPEVFYDEESKNFYIFWASSTRVIETLKARFKGDHKIYFMKTKDFDEFSEPKLLLEPWPKIYAIDPFMLKANGEFHLFLKVESHNQTDGEKDGIHHSSSKNLEGPYKRLSATLPKATGDSEGPTALELPEGYVIYYDYSYGNGAFFSEDLELFWDVSAEVKLPENFRHGTAIEISKELLREIKRAY